MTSTTKTLTLAQCRALARAAFESDGERFGIECEWPTRPRGDRSARSDYTTLSQIAKVAPRGGSNVSLEPGGQLELSSAAFDSPGACFAALRADEAWLHARIEEHGLEWGPESLDETRLPELVLPYDRYHAMAAYWDAGGPAGRWMMTNTTSIQLNISNDPTDAELRWQVTNVIGPVLVAMFANSGGEDATGARWESLRQGIWASMHPCRTAPVRLDIPGPEAWLEYALNADVFLIRTRGTHAGRGLAPGFTFAEWMANGHELGWPTAEDFAYHLTTLFPPVRPKGWLELRMLDSLPPRMRTAAALTVAIATRTGVAREVLAAMPYTACLWRSAARRGLHDARLRHAAEALVAIVLAHTDAVEAGAEDFEALRQYFADFTLRGFSPSMLHRMHLPAPLVTESFDERLTGQTIPQSLAAARQSALRP